MLDPHPSDKLDAALDTLERSVEGRGDGDGGVSRPASPGALAAAQRALVTTVVPELGLLRLFVVLNYTAVVKARAREPPTHVPSRDLRSWKKLLTHRGVFSSPGGEEVEQACQPRR